MHTMPTTIATQLSGCSLPLLEAEVLLCALLQKDRSWLLGHAEDLVPEPTQQRFAVLVQRRLEGEPIAYLTGHKEFYGRDFTVNPYVLIPRPCTEHLIDTCINTLKTPTIEQTTTSIDTEIIAWKWIWQPIPANCLLVDIGTGTGAIACTLALETNNQIIATDISESALGVAAVNVKKLGAENQITFRLGNCLEPVDYLTQPFLIVSNPPYIPINGYVEKNVRKYEPDIALFSGNKGIDVLQTIVTQAKAHPQCCGFIIECREEQSTCIPVK